MNYWVCRAGMKNSQLKYFLDNNVVSCPWQDFNMSWTGKTKEDLKNEISRVKSLTNKTSISNLCAQIQVFTEKMDVNDIVILPDTKRKCFYLGKIVSEYIFERNEIEERQHYRRVIWQKKPIENSCFTQDFRYTLGAFRTIFQIKKSEHIAQVIKYWEG